MRLAHVTATYAPHNTGTGNVARYNALELVRRGHEVHVFTVCEPGAPFEETLDGVHVHRLRPWMRYGNAALIPKLYRALRPSVSESAALGRTVRPHFDLIHLHMPFYGGCEAVYALKRLHGIPLVITHHQDVTLSGPASIISAVHDRLIGRALMRAADRACFTSLDYARASRFAGLLAAGKLRAAELPNGVDPERFTPGPRPTDLVRRIGLEGQIVVLFVGVLDQAHGFKGVPLLLRALARIDRQDMALVVVGEGDMRPVYAGLARELGLVDRVHFAGFVPDDRLPGYYRLADVTVLPSTTMGEAFGLVLVESLASGTPVIASDLPGVRTVVAPDEDGVLVPPGDIDHLAQQLAQMAAMPEERRCAMGLAGRRKVAARYAWTSIGADLTALYEAVLAEHRLPDASQTPVEARI